jgi:hypothetical protein
VCSWCGSWNNECQWEKTKCSRRCGLAWHINAHDKEFEDLLRPKASGINEDVEACEKANAPLEKNWRASWKG